MEIPAPPSDHIPLRRRCAFGGSNDPISCQTVTRVAGTGAGLMTIATLLVSINIAVVDRAARVLS